MRMAQISDHWRHIKRKEFPNRLESISIRGVVGFEDITVELNGGINAICGPNGAGKSTLLCLIYKYLTKTFDFSASLLSRIQNASFVATGADNNSKFVINCNVNSGDYDAVDNFVLFNPSSECIHLLNALNSDRDLDGLLDPIEPQVYNASDIEWLSYITGKIYDAVICFNIEDAYEKPVIPFFKIQSRGVEYTTLEMGLGELCAFYVYWYLMEISKSIVIIEEIESHLSPNSQRAIMDCIARFSDSRGLFFLISTHSPEIVSKLDYNSIKLLLPRRFSSELVHPDDQGHCLNALGLRLGKRGIVFVEDEGAKWFLEHIFNYLDATRTLETLELVITHGEANITKALVGLPSGIDALVFIGVYDGDMKINAGRLSSNWPVFFLPLVAPPDLLLKNMCYGLEERYLAALLGKPPKTVGRNLAEFEAVDHHDWIESFAHGIGYDKRALFTPLFSEWIKSPNNYKESVILFDEVMHVISNHPH